MSDLPNRSDLFAIGRRAIINTPNARINPAVIDIPGSDTNLLLNAMSLIGEEIIARLSECMRENFIEVARGSQLDRVAFDRYGLSRFPATPARVELVMTRPLPGIATPGTYPAGSRVQSADGTQFATDIDATFGNFDTTLPVSATALVAGPDSNLSADTITQYADQPFDTTFVLNNPEGAAGGNEAELDVDFRGRIRDFFPTVRRGTKGALEFGARQVPGIVTATAIEIMNLLLAGPLPAGLVELIVGDAAGNASPPLIQSVIDTMIDWRALGIPVEVIGGSPAPAVFVVWDLEFQTGIDTVLAATQIQAVTSAAAQFLNPGETLYKSTLIAAARTVPGVIIHEGSLVAPLGDVVPTSSNLVIRIPIANVSFV